MTHEELLAMIEEKIDNVESISGIKATPWHSLRAVVELHKPKVKPGTPNDLLCEECARQCTGNGHLFYPCPTIQVIEKELQ